MNKKGFAPIILIVIVGLLATGGTWYYVDHQIRTLDNSLTNSSVVTSTEKIPSSTLDPEKTQPTPTNRQSPTSETSEWETYQNIEYDYSIRYPAGWKVVEQRITGPNQNLNMFSMDLYDSQHPTSSRQPSMWLSILPCSNPVITTFPIEKISVINDLTVDNIPAKETKSPTILLPLIMFGKENYFYQFQTNPRMSVDWNQAKQILQTLKFTNQNSPSPTSCWDGILKRFPAKA